MVSRIGLKIIISSFIFLIVFATINLYLLAAVWTQAWYTSVRFREIKLFTACKKFATDVAKSMFLGVLYAVPIVNVLAQFFRRFVINDMTKHICCFFTALSFTVIFFFFHGLASKIFFPSQWSFIALKRISV